MEKSSANHALRLILSLAAVLLVCILARPLLTVAEEDVAAEGVCGNGLTWTLTNEGVLTITGEQEEAAINNYDWYWSTPWYPYISGVKELVLDVHGNLTISDSAFGNCENLEKVNISSDCIVVSVGENAFNSCWNLNTIENSKNIRKLGVCAFSECNSLGEIDLSGLQEEKIPFRAFANCSSLQEIRIPESITEIGGEAFFSCHNLKTVIFEGDSRLSTIDNEAFVDCISLNHVVLPESVTTIGYCAFSGCRSLTDIRGINQITSLEGGAFGYTAFREFTVPSGIRSLPGGCFNGCEQLETVDLNNVTILEGENFSGCYSLKTIEHLENVRKIGSGTFCNCTSLTEFTFPEKVKVASDQVLIGCKNLETLNLNNVKRIEAMAFKNCPKLNTAVHNGYITSIADGAFQDCPKLEEFLVSYGVTEIKENTFSGCEGLKRIFIPATVTDIDYEAFSGVESLTIFTDHTLKSAKGIFDDLETYTGDDVKVYYNIAPDQCPISNFQRLPSKIMLVSKTVYYSGKTRKIGKADVTGSSGKITYTYFTNPDCSKKTTVKKNGAAVVGGAPKNSGTYYVTASVRRDSYFKKATSKPVKLTIKPKVSFGWKQYQGYDYIYPWISGLKRVKSYYVELYDGQGKLLRRTKSYTKAMKIGVRPGSGTGAKDIYQTGQKYKVKVIFTMRDRSRITVKSKYKKKF